MKIAIGQLEFIHPLLREILMWVERTYGEQTITSLYRIDDTGVHGTLPLRGADMRDNGREESERIMAGVNGRWVYDPERPHIGCCLYHKNRWSDGFHLHFQVHPNTVRRGA